MCEAENIARNVHMVMETLAGTSVSSSEPLKLVVDKVSVVLEELRTLQILAETHSGGLSDQINTIDKSIQQAEQIFNNIDELKAFIERSKATLDKLERLANVVERH